MVLTHPKYGDTLTAYINNMDFQTLLQQKGAIKTNSNVSSNPFLKNQAQPTTQPKNQSFLSAATNNLAGVTKDLGSLAKSTGSFVQNNLPAIGATAGAVGGGIIGTLGGPEGTYAGAVAGATAGGALGETAKQGLQNLEGTQKGLSGKDIAKQGVEMGALEAVGGPILKVGGKLVSSIGEGLVKAVIPTSAKEAGLIQTYKAGKSFLERLGNIVGVGKDTSPNTAAKTVFNKGLIGTESMIGVQAKRASNSIWKDFLQPQLDKYKVKVNMDSFFKTAEDKIIKNNPELSIQKTLLEALESFKEDYAGVKDVALKDLQKFKEGWAKYIPEKAYKGKPIAGAANNVKDILADISRETIYKALGSEAKQAYFDYGNLQGIQELGQKAMTGSGLKGGFGSFWNTVKDMALTPVGTIGGQTIYKVGQGIQLIGNPGGRIVRDLFVPSSSQPQLNNTQATQ